MGIQRSNMLSKPTLSVAIPAMPRYLAGVSSPVRLAGGLNASPLLPGGVLSPVQLLIKKRRLPLHLQVAKPMCTASPTTRGASFRERASDSYQKHSDASLYQPNSPVVASPVQQQPNIEQQQAGSVWTPKIQRRHRRASCSAPSSDQQNSRAASRKAFKEDKQTRKAATDECEECQSSFGFFLWKHSCSSCCRVLCDDCAPHREQREARTCQDCEAPCAVFLNRIPYSPVSPKLHVQNIGVCPAASPVVISCSWNVHPAAAGA